MRQWRAALSVLFALCFAVWEQGAQLAQRLYFAAPQSVQAECFAAVTLSVESACKAAASYFAGTAGAPAVLYIAGAAGVPAVLYFAGLVWMTAALYWTEIDCIAAVARCLAVGYATPQGHCFVNF